MKDDLTNWLHEKIEKLVKPNSLLLDIGGYHGDFTRSLLGTGKFAKAILFEPNPVNLAVIKNNFKNDSRVTTVDLAVSNQEGTASFYYSDDLATGSVLSYDESTAAAPNSPINKIQVKQIKLDNFIADNYSNLPISMMKVDTQGGDLNVLKGAERILNQHAPILIIELIFIDLYKQQSYPHDILSWLSQKNYTLGGIFNEHYSKDNWLAFADAVFVPQSMPTSFEVPFQIKPNLIHLQAENEMLRRVCEERLDLINRLHNECAKRLEIIQRLESKIK